MHDSIEKSISTARSRYLSGPDIPGFLLQPFRKPKRIRTAFSPSQLLKLEHAFEKNHYVIGAERKQLAQALSLSETQVRICQFCFHVYLFLKFSEHYASASDVSCFYSYYVVKIKITLF